MHVLLTGVAIAVGASAMPESAGGEPRRADECASQGGRTLLGNSVVRLFVTRDKLGNRSFRHCWRATGRLRTFRRGAGGRRLVKHLRLVGRYYAYSYERVSDDTPGVGLQVVVRDARRSSGAVGFRAQPPGDERELFYTDGEPGVMDVETTSGGALAWIAPGRPNADEYFYVQRADAQAAGQVVLDQGASIDPNSLAVSDGRMYWTNGGVPRSARIRGKASTGR